MTATQSRSRPSRPLAPIAHADGRCRCPWAGLDPLYIAYHDDEWGVPEHDERALFEKLVLESFQAGLSWITILRKRENFRHAFDGFDPYLVARYDEAKIVDLMGDTGIVRNRAKIANAIRIARFVLDEQARGGFAARVWSFVGGQPRTNRFATADDVPVDSEASRAMAAHFRAQGLRFCGPTILYAFMQAAGLVDDHLVGCYRHGAVRSGSIA